MHGRIAVTELEADAVYHLPLESLSTDSLGGHLSAMALLAILAYPCENAEAYCKRDRLIRMLKADYVKLRQSRAGGKHQTWAPPELRALRPDHIGRALDKATDLINRRLIAARMAQYALLGRIADPARWRVGIPPPVLSRRRRPQYSLRNIAERMIEVHPSELPGNPDDVLKRIWAPAKPVLHLAMALSIMLARRELTLRHQVATAPDWLPGIMHDAEARVAVLRLAFDLPSLIRLLPADDQHSSIG